MWGGEELLLYILLETCGDIYIYTFPYNVRRMEVRSLFLSSCVYWVNITYTITYHKYIAQPLPSHIVYSLSHSNPLATLPHVQF